MVMFLVCAYSHDRIRSHELVHETCCKNCQANVINCIRAIEESSHYFVSFQTFD
jgi:hypothetical protein